MLIVEKKEDVAKALSSQPKSHMRTKLLKVSSILIYTFLECSNVWIFKTKKNSTGNLFIPVY